MGRYTLRRLLQLIPVFLGTTFLIYWLVWSLPGDPFAGKCGDRGCPPAYIAQMHAKFHMDEPLPIQYLYYLQRLIFDFDLGESFNGRPVSEIVAQAWPITARLALLALLFEAVIGISAGVLTGLRRGGFLDNVTLIATLVLIAIPIFVIGSTLVLWLPAIGMKGTVSSADPGFTELIIPGLVLASGQLAYMTRLSRTSLVENLRTDYARTAMAKGLTRRRVVGIHLLRNSMIPVVTLLGLDLGGLMGGAIITERIFNINGVGGTIANAIFRYDASIVVPMVTVLVVVYLLMNLLVDLLYGVLDPRIRFD